MGTWLFSDITQEYEEAIINTDVLFATRIDAELWFHSSILVRTLSVAPEIYI